MEGFSQLAMHGAPTKVVVLLPLTNPILVNETVSCYSLEYPVIMGNLFSADSTPSTARFYEGITLLYGNPNKEFPQNFDPCRPFMTKSLARVSREGFVGIVNGRNGPSAVVLLDDKIREDPTKFKLQLQSPLDCELRNNATYAVVHPTPPMPELYTNVTLIWGNPEENFADGFDYKDPFKTVPLARVSREGFVGIVNGRNGPSEVVLLDDKILEDPTKFKLQLQSPLDCELRNNATYAVVHPTPPMPELYTNVTLIWVNPEENFADGFDYRDPFRVTVIDSVSRESFISRVEGEDCVAVLPLDDFLNFSLNPTAFILKEKTPREVELRDNATFILIHSGGKGLRTRVSTFTHRVLLSLVDFFKSSLIPFFSKFIFVSFVQAEQLIGISRQGFIRAVDRRHGDFVVALEDYPSRDLSKKDSEDIELRDGATYIVLPRKEKNYEQAVSSLYFYASRFVIFGRFFQTNADPFLAKFNFVSLIL